MSDDIFTPALDEGSILLAEDAGDKLVLSDSNFLNGFLLTIIDDAGFIGFLIADEEWPRIRKLIDDFIASRQI